MRVSAGGTLYRWSTTLIVLGLACLPGVYGQEKKDKNDPVTTAPKAVLLVRCDRADALYHVGEKAKFILTSTTAGDATYRLSDDGVGTLREGKATFKAGESFHLTETLNKPGFLQLQVTQGKSKALAAAAFDPTKIEPTAKMPADFDSFWDASKKELAKVPLDAQLEKVDKLSSDRVTCYKFSLANIDGKRVHGWLSVPKGKGPFPAILTVPGAGVSGISPIPTTPNSAHCR